MSRGVNTMNLCDITLRNAKLYPNRAAVVFENRRCTYAQFAARASMQATTPEDVY